MLTGTLPQISNQETWVDNLEFFDDATGDAWFTQANTSSHPDEVTLKLRNVDTQKIELSKSLSAGDLTITGDGVISFSLDISALCAKTYEVGCLYTKNSVTTQVILGRMPVLDGF